MGTPSHNACPRCNQIPDVPGDIGFGGFLLLTAAKGSSPFFCNHCGAKLQVLLTERGKMTVESTWQTRKAAMGRIDSVFIQVGELSSEDLRVAWWHDLGTTAFLSYSHKDEAWCQPFAQSLKRAGLDIFYDDGNIGSGADWVKEIEHAIDTRRFFIVVLTPDAWASEWVQRELSCAFAAKRTIIPMLLLDTKVEGFLRAVQWIDVRGKTPEEAAALIVERVSSEDATRGRAGSGPT